MDGPQHKLSFPKRMHLRKTAQFDRVFKEGRRVGSRHVLARVAANTEGHPRVGFAVPKGIGCIAARNRVRRVMREAFRLHQHLLTAGVDVVLIPKRSWSDYRLSAITPSMRSLLRKIQDECGRDEVAHHRPD